MLSRLLIPDCLQFCKKDYIMLPEKEKNKGYNSTYFATGTLNFFDYACDIGQSILILAALSLDLDLNLILLSHQLDLQTTRLCMQLLFFHCSTTHNWGKTLYLIHHGCSLDLFQEMVSLLIWINSLYLFQGRVTQLLHI